MQNWLNFLVAGFSKEKYIIIEEKLWAIYLWDPRNILFHQDTMDYFCFPPPVFPQVLAPNPVYFWNSVNLVHPRLGNQFLSGQQMSCCVKIFQLHSICLSNQNFYPFERIYFILLDEKGYQDMNRRGTKTWWQWSFLSVLSFETKPGGFSMSGHCYWRWAALESDQTL